MIDALKFRDRWEAYRIEAMKSAATHERVMLQAFLLSHADALLALVEAHKGKTVLIDADERTTVRIFTPHEETKP